MSSGCEFSVLKSQPECVIMEINEPVGKGLTHLQSCQFSVFPKHSSFQIKLPMCKRLVSVNRTQAAFGTCILMHWSQKSWPNIR